MNSGILVVEDERIVAKDIEHTLRDMGYPVVGIASSGEEAVRKALELRPELVLMDIHLGEGLDGIEAATLIRAKLDAAVVFLTAYSDPETLERTRAAAPYGYMVKPFKDSELRAVIETATHQHGTTRLLRERERILAHALQYSGDAVFGMDGHTVYLNPIAEQLTGWNADEAVGRRAEEVLQFELEGEPSRPVAHPARVALEEAARTELAEGAVLIRRGGGRVPVEATAAPILGPDGRAHGVVVVLRDVSERRAAAAALRQANVRLEEGNRALEAFASSVAHDLRAPLRTISGYADLLLDGSDGPLEPEARALVERMALAAQRMNAMVQGLLGLARVGSGVLVRAPLDLGEIAAELVGELREHAPGRVLEFTTGSGLLAEGDATLVRVLLGNLLANAWKFTANTEGARVELGRDEHGFFVRDNGAGFDMAYAGKLFAPLERLHGDQEFPGTGIGLATVKRVAERHGGRVWARGEVGRGATFWFTLG